MLPRSNLALIPCCWLLWDTFQTRNRSSKHRGDSFNLTVWLHFNCQRDLLCHQLDLPAGRTEILNICQSRRVNRHPAESDEDGAPESVSDTDDCDDWNGDLDNPNDSEDYCAVDIGSDIAKDNSIEDREWPEQRDMSASPTVPRLIQATRKSKSQADKVLMTVNAIETRRHNGMNKK